MPELNLVTQNPPKSGFVHDSIFICFLHNFVKIYTFIHKAKIDSPSQNFECYHSNLYTAYKDQSKQHKFFGKWGGCTGKIWVC